MMLDKKKIQMVFLFEFKMDCKAAEMEGAHRLAFCLEKIQTIIEYSPVRVKIQMQLSCRSKLNRELCCSPIDNFFFPLL